MAMRESTRQRLEAELFRRWEGVRQAVQPKLGLQVAPTVDDVGIVFEQVAACRRIAKRLAKAEGAK